MFPDPRWWPGSPARGPVLLAALSVACAANPSKLGKESLNEPGSGAGGSIGATLENPVPLCGPEDSTRYVASEFACPSGGNPFAGDLEAARQARRGSDQNPKTGHIIDVYRVPCQPQSIHLFVDLYACEEYRQHLLRAGQPSRELVRLIARYESLDFRGVAQRCAHQAEAMPLDEASECMSLLPASLVMLRRFHAGIGLLGEYCSQMPEPNGFSEQRAHLVVRTVAFVDHARELVGDPLSDDEGSSLLGAFGSVCGVSSSDLERYVKGREPL